MDFDVSKQKVQSSEEVRLWVLLPLTDVTLGTP